MAFKFANVMPEREASVPTNVGVFATPPVDADDYYFLRYALVEVLPLANHQAEAPAKPRRSIRAAKALETASSRLA
jgi:hypothetical protein